MRDTGNLAAESEQAQRERMKREAPGLLNVAPHSPRPYCSACEPEPEPAPENMSRLLLSLIGIISSLILAINSNWYLIGTGICSLWFVYEGIVITKGAERP